MTIHVLVIDANTSFATMMKQALDDLGEYRATVASGAPEAIGLAAKQAFDVAIVDMGLPDVTGEDTIRGLRATRPTLPIIAIPFGADRADPVFEGLDVQGFLSKPFFLPELAGIVDEALERPVGGVTPPPRKRPAKVEAAPVAATVAEAPAPKMNRAATPTQTPEWLKDGAIATRLLAGLIRQTTAEAALLTSGTQLIAYAGPFPKQDTEELARIVTGHFSSAKYRGKPALMRYVKLSTSGSDYLLFATTVTADTVVALAFKPEVPFGTARKHAREAAAVLLQTPARDGRGAGQTPAANQRQRPRPAPATAPLPPETLLDFDRTETQTQPQPRPAQVDTIVPRPRAAPATAPLPPEVLFDSGLQVSDTGQVQTPHTLYNLAYTLAWAPKYPKTRLAGDISGLLNEWIRHIALAYDWRIERVEVRPECVVAIINCPPTTAPEQMVNTLKRATSDKVLTTFPSLAADHPGGDFWAPGYLLLGAGQPLSPGQIADFLAHTRRSQGLSR